MTDEMREALKHMNAMVSLGMGYEDARQNVAVIFGVDSYDLATFYKQQEVLNVQ